MIPFSPVLMPSPSSLRSVAGLLLHKDSRGKSFWAVDVQKPSETPDTASSTRAIDDFGDIAANEFVGTLYQRPSGVGLIEHVRYTALGEGPQIQTDGGTHFSCSSYAVNMHRLASVLGGKASNHD